QHTEPTTTTVYPILADPKQQSAEDAVVEQIMGNETTEVTVEHNVKANRGGQDTMSYFGDPVSRDTDGKVTAYPLGHPDDVTVRTLPTGASQVTDSNGRTTTYYPVVEQGVVDSPIVASESFDETTGITTQEILYPNGDTTLQTTPGKRFTNGPAGTYTGPEPIISDPDNPTPAIVYDTPDPHSEQTDGTTLVTHHDTGTTDVITPGKTPTTVNTETGNPIHLGTTDHPIQGPIVPSEPEHEDNSVGAKGLGQINAAVGGGAGATEDAYARITELQDQSKHVPSKAGLQTIKQTVHASRIAGVALGAANVAQAEDKPRQAVIEIGSLAAGEVGSVVGGSIGFAVGGPAGAYLGGAVGALIGSELGARAATHAYDHATR
ncbi:DUF456 domain-containing protein, partial [Corynebacterium pelargi]